MKFSNSLLFCLLVGGGNAFARPDGGKAHVNRDESSDEPSTFAFTVSRVNIPRTLHDPNNKRVVELFERQGSCGVAQVACSDGGCCVGSCCGDGCCPIGYYCDSSGGETGCCPVGRICSGQSNTCPGSNLYYCGSGFDHCCPNGSSCYHDSEGHAACSDSGGGGGTGGDGGSGGGSGGDGGSSGGDTGGSGGDTGGSGGSTDTGGGGSGSGNGDQEGDVVATTTTSVRIATTASPTTSRTNILATTTSRPLSTTSLDTISLGAAGKARDFSTFWLASVFGLGLLLF